jgi:GR25 family glycosyltransferase involved in LPS biosynthesis
VNLDKYFDRIIVINLDRRTDRLEEFTKQAERIGFDFEVHKAIDGQFLGMSPIVAGRLSHIEVLRKIKPDEKVLICEDDAVFRDDFNEVIDDYMADLPEDWDIFYLGALKNEVREVNKHWVRQVVSTGTQAYCVNPAKVDLFIEIAREFEKWIDVAYRLWADRTNAYIAHPNLVIQSAGFSDLRGESVQDFKGFQ